VQAGTNCSTVMFTSLQQCLTCGMTRVDFFVYLLSKYTSALLKIN